MDKLPANIKRVIGSVLGVEGHSSQDLRSAAAKKATAASGMEIESATLPQPLEGYVGKLISTPYKIIERDIEALRDSGMSEDQIFELTVATAVGCAASRYERIVDLLEQSKDGALK